MRALLYKALAIIAIVAAIDLAVGWLTNRTLVGLSDRISQIGSIQQSMMTKKGDVLILGASCAKYHYDPRILADSLHMSVQNTGIGGMNMIYSDLVLQAYLERCTPRCIVVDVYGQLDPGEGRLPRIKPFYGLSQPVTRYYNTETNWQQRLKLQSNLYRLNGTLDLLLRHQFNAANTTNGFAVKEGEIPKLDTMVVHHFQMDSVKVRHLHHLVQLCRQHHVLPVFVLSPRRYHDADQEAWMIAFCREQNITLINELHTPIYYQTDGLFFDESHLNGKGAKIFSQRVASQLKTVLQLR